MGYHCLATCTAEQGGYSFRCGAGPRALTMVEPGAITGAEPSADPESKFKHKTA